MEENEYLEMLRKADLKITPKRRAIIRFFLQNKRCFSPEKLWEALKRDFEHLGLPTIYRNLKELEDVGILVRIIRPDQRLYYAICHLEKRKEHHHFVCKRCGRVKEVDFCNFEDIAGEIEEKLNSRITSHIMQVEGLCGECKQGE